MKLTLEQERARKLLTQRIVFNKEKISILTGPAGTGKSTVLSFLLQSLGYSKEEVAFVSYTGAAAKVLQKKGLNASTIHSLIYKPIIIRGTCIGFKKEPYENLSNLKLIVVDEFSMLPQDILTDLLSYNIPLLLVGDPYQLEAIGDQNEFVGKTHAHLNNVMRQALDSPLLWAATRIREGKPLYNDIYGNSLLVGRRKDVDESWFRKEVKFIVGTNKTKDEINLMVAGHNGIQKGDNIIFLKNDWKHNIVNGTTAEVLDFKMSFKTFNLDIITDDDMRMVNYKAIRGEPVTKKDQKSQRFDLSYAITTHKSQGQTFDQSGLIIDETKYFKGQEKKILYTALTRFTGNYNVALIRGW